MRILREAERKQESIRDVCKRHNITEQTFFRWRNKLGGMDVAEAKRLKELESENAKLKRMLAEQLLVIEGLKEFTEKKTSPSGRQAAVRALTCRGISERRACQILGLSRRVSSYVLRQLGKNQALSTRLMEATQDVPRFGYRRMTAWLDVGEARVRRLWHSLGLHQPRKRARRRCSGCDIRLPGAVHPNSVWSYDFVHDQFVDGRVLKMLCVLDEHTRECLAIVPASRLRSQDVILMLSRLMRISGKPEHIRSDNGAEFTARSVMRWLRDEAISPASGYKLRTQVTGRLRVRSARAAATAVRPHRRQRSPVLQGGRPRVSAHATRQVSM